jgi:hypothetical protein
LNTPNDPAPIHRLARLNRGLRSVSAEEVFNAKPAAADCETTVTAKYP